MSTGLEQFLQQSEQTSEENNSTFLQMAFRLASGEDIGMKEITRVCKAAQKSADELTAAIENGHQIRECLATIEIERRDAAESGDFYQRMKLDRQEQLREIDRIMNLMAAVAIENRISINAESARKAACSRIRTSADEAMRTLIDLDSPSYGVALPDRTPFSVPSMGYQPSQIWDSRLLHVQRRILAHFELAAGEPALPPLTDAEREVLTSPDFQRRLSETAYATILVRSLKQIPAESVDDDDDDAIDLAADDEEIGNEDAETVDEADVDPDDDDGPLDPSALDD